MIIIINFIYIRKVCISKLKKKLTLSLEKTENKVVTKKKRVDSLFF